MLDGQRVHCGWRFILSVPSRSRPKESDIENLGFGAPVRWNQELCGPVHIDSLHFSVQ